MRVIKFTKKYEAVLSFDDREFEKKYEERTKRKGKYVQEIGGEKKYLALCPRCNNPVVILGIYKRIAVAPHARHAKNVEIPGVAIFNEYEYLRCPYHRKKANYVKEYVDETKEEGRHELYKIAKEHYDKAIYLLQKTTGIYISLHTAESLARNYAELRVYNYIDATLYNIPWYLLYSYNGFDTHRLIVRKDSPVFRHLRSVGLEFAKSNIEGYGYVITKNEYAIISTGYRYSVGKDDNLNEWLDFSIVEPDEKVKETLLYKPIKRFSVKVDSYYFGNLVNYKDWKPQQKLLDIASKYMNP